MKITSDHYSHIKCEIKKLSDLHNDEIKLHYSKLVSGEIRCNNPKIRLMYDLQRKARLLDFVTNTLYKYCDDSHYQTALLKIGKELELL